MITVIATVVIAHFLALISPGPDFILIVKSAIKNTKKNALGIAVGISLANGIYITLCIVGVAAVLATSLIIMTIIKVLGGLFLIYICFKALTSKKSDYAFINNKDNQKNLNENNSFFSEFLTGFISGLSNPKNIIFYLSLFSVVLTNDVDVSFKIILGLWMTSLVFIWDTFIILVLSRNSIKSFFSRIAFYIDKIAGTILGIVGIKLVHSALTEDIKI